MLYPTYDPSAHNDNHIRVLQTISKEQYFISFIVIFTHVNSNDYIRIFSNGSIVDEVACDTKIKKIDVPIDYQKDIQFQMLGDNNNACRFYFVGLSKQIDGHHRHKKFKFLFSQTNWHKDTLLENIAYAGNMFGRDFHNTIVKPNKHMIKFSCLLTLQKGQHYGKVWHDSITDKNYLALSDSWISTFRPGIACFYRKQYQHLLQIRNTQPFVNVFKDIVFDFDNNTAQLTKSTGKIISLPIDYVMRVKKINNEEQYLNFVHDALIFYPAVILNWHDFKL